MKARHKRLSIVIGGLGVLGLLTWLALNVFESNMMLFQSPSDVVAGKAPQGKSFRLGGLVEEGTLERENDGLTVHFIVTDKVESIPVTYTGILPDLFREGQGVVAQGKLENGVFTAHEVLAKHDEEYMSPEVADALKRAEEKPNGGSI